MSISNIEKYQALVIDTCIFFDNGFGLESGLLTELFQLSSKNIQVLLPDIVHKELIKHLTGKISKISNDIQKALKGSGYHIDSIRCEAQQIENRLAELNPEHTANSRITKFIENTDAVILDSNSLIELKDLVNAYFYESAPFLASSKKKHEFPDAIALLSIEAWSKKHNKKVLAVSRDHDWQSFCANLESIDCISTLSEALSKVNSSIVNNNYEIEFCELLKKHDSKYLIKRLEDELDGSLSMLTPEVEAIYNIYSWSAYCNLSLGKLDLLDRISLISSDIDHFYIEIDCILEVNASAEFEFFYDEHRANSFICSDLFEKLLSNKNSLIIRVAGSIEDMRELDIESVELKYDVGPISFGVLEPDFGENW
jgi:hypothetical protein